MKYAEIKEVAEEDDPSVTLETRDLVAKVIDNTGLVLPPNPESQDWAARYGLHKPLPFSRRVGNHGIRTFYHKQERRNVVAPLACWLNFQNVSLQGIENDAVDDRVWAGTPRGWPLRIEARAGGARLVLDPLPQTQFSYVLDVAPAEPDALDFTIELTFHRLPERGRPIFRGAWSCYMNSLDDVRLFYPKGTVQRWEWGAVGEKADFIPGETVGYSHQQAVYFAEQQALPLGYMQVGPYAVALMFDNSAVRLFVVNAGGHLFFNPLHNPAFDFEWVIEDYPVEEPVRLAGRIVYAKFQDANEVLERYSAWNRSMAIKDWIVARVRRA